MHRHRHVAERLPSSFPEQTVPILMTIGHEESTLTSSVRTRSDLAFHSVREWHIGSVKVEDTVSSWLLIILVSAGEDGWLGLMVCRIPVNIVGCQFMRRVTALTADSLHYFVANTPFWSIFQFQGQFAQVPEVGAALHEAI